MNKYQSNYTQWFYFPNRQTCGYVQEDGTYWIVNGGWGAPREELEETYGSTPVLLVPTHCMLIDQLYGWSEQLQLVEDLYNGHIGSVYQTPEQLSLTEWAQMPTPKQTLGSISIDDFE